MPDPNLPEPQDAEEIILETYRGRKESPEELFAQVYQELRQVARAYMRHERADHTLQATALVKQYAEIIRAGEEKVGNLDLIVVPSDTEDQGPPIGVEFPLAMGENGSAGPTLVELPASAPGNGKSHGNGNGNGQKKRSVLLIGAGRAGLLAHRLARGLSRRPPYRRSPSPEHRSATMLVGLTRQVPARKSANRAPPKGAFGVSIG